MGVDTCMHKGMYAAVGKSECQNIHIQACIHNKYTYTRASMHIYMYAAACTPGFTYNAYITYTHTHACMHAYINAAVATPGCPSFYIHACLHTCIHMHAYTNAAVGTPGTPKVSSPLADPYARPDERFRPQVYLFVVIYVCTCVKGNCACVYV
jgi:hypothetical protein